MPKPFQYRTGSLIYFQGDPADKIYILQNGKVSLVYQDIETGADLKDPVQPGEFFGVKSALGRYSREENAVALSDCTVMAFTVPEFEAVAMANTRIIMKMLKVFSNQMRRVHKQVSKLLEKEEAEPADGLYNIGEFYLKNKRFSQAKYVFNRYLTYYPSGRHAFQASKHLDTVENSLSRYGDGKGPSMSTGSDTKSAGGSGNVGKFYSDAVSFYSQGKYQDAFVLFRSVMDANADPELTVKSSFEAGRCLFLLQKHEECLRLLTNVLTRYPKHPSFAEIMFIMGQCNESMGRNEQAAAFYKKVLSMGFSETDETIIKVRRALGALGA